MLQLLSPLALVALAGLLAPLVIHLLRRKSGKHVKVGSIKFLIASESRRLKSLKLNEIALLLLRCALLAVLALLLAQPQWLGFAPQSAPRGWVLIAPELLPIADARLQGRVDSLTAAGHELRAFAPNFPRLPEASANPVGANYWSLARELAHETRGSKSVWIFTSDATQHYRGERPAVPEKILWQSHTNSKPRQWLHAAKLLREDSLQFLVGSSTAQRTIFSRFTANRSQLPATLAIAEMPPVEVFPSQNGRALQLLERSTAARQDSAHMTISREPKIITIYFDEPHAGDRRYVQAALESATEFAAAPWQVRSVPLPGNGASFSRNEVAFWLSESSLPQELEEHLAKGTLLVTDAGASKYRVVSSEIVPRGFALENPPRLWRKTSAPLRGLALWREAQGEALLSAESVGAGWHLRFASRFHPQWNELVLHPMFPEMMLRLLERRDFDNEVELEHDQRRLTLAQTQPQQGFTSTHAQATPRATSLHLPLWFLAAMLFAWERRLSERRVS